MFLALCQLVLHFKIVLYFFVHFFFFLSLTFFDILKIHFEQKFFNLFSSVKKIISLFPFSMFGLFSLF